MKKLSIIVFFFLFAHSLDGQTRMTIIDKSEINVPETEVSKALFDYNDPYSLLSIISNNILVNIEPMDQFTKELLQLLGYGKQLSYGLSPLRSDPNATNNDLIKDAETRDSFFYDPKGITRIIVYEDLTVDKNTGKKQYKIDKIGFAKRYGNNPKYFIVFALKYEYLMEMSGFKVLEKLPKTINSKLTDDNSPFYQNIKKYCLETYEKNVKLKENEWSFEPENINFFSDGNPYSNILLLFSEFLKNQRRLNIEPEKLIYYNPDLHDWPIKKSLTQQEITNFCAKPNNCYQLIESQIEIPLLDVNGNDSLEYNNGEINIVYPPATIRTYWVDFKNIQTYALYELGVDGDENNPLLEKIFFTTEYKGETHTVFTLTTELRLQHTFQFPDSLSSYLTLLEKNDGQFIEKHENLPWKQPLLHEFSTSKQIFYPNKKEDQLLLSRQFNLKPFVD